MSILFNSQARATATRSLTQLNTLTKYPSILTLHALGERGRLTTDFTTPALFAQSLTATKKIDGTNTRLLVFADGSYVVGSRENLLTVSDDLLFDPAVGIVDGLRRLVFPQFVDEYGHLPRFVYTPPPVSPRRSLCCSASSTAARSQVTPSTTARPRRSASASSTWQRFLMPTP
ncbi:hypothetical protein [Hymenobacter sp. NBH84]|uniref:hypothetical protein n=1 Tax=Hymenobacter sp. NBH84 TaxID=2596915 RepID=UPI001CA5CA2B|nr:hypothetical protein [Hymenobacter sp. NBH84]